MGVAPTPVEGACMRAVHCPLLKGEEACMKVACDPLRGLHTSPCGRGVACNPVLGGLHVTPLKGLVAG